MKHGKKYVEAAKLVDRAVAYEPAEAVALVKKTAVAKFDEESALRRQHSLLRQLLPQQPYHPWQILKP